MSAHVFPIRSETHNQGSTLETFATKTLEENMPQPVKLTESWPGMINFQTPKDTIEEMPNFQTPKDTIEEMPNLQTQKYTMENVYKLKCSLKLISV